MYEVKSESEGARLCPTLSDPMARSLPGSSIHGIFQARVLEWDAIALSESTQSYSKDKEQKEARLVDVRGRRNCEGALKLRGRWRNLGHRVPAPGGAMEGTTSVTWRSQK